MTDKRVEAQEVIGKPEAVGVSEIGEDETRTDQTDDAAVETDRRIRMQIERIERMGGSVAGNAAFEASSSPGIAIDEKVFIRELKEELGHIAEMCKTVHDAKKPDDNTADAVDDRDAKSLTELIIAAAAEPSNRTNFSGLSSIDSDNMTSVPSLEMDNILIVIEANGAKRAFSQAIHHLGKIIQAIPELQLGTDISLLREFLDLAFKLDLLVSEFGYFSVQLGREIEQSGHLGAKRSIVELFRRLGNLFDAGVKTSCHTDYVHDLVSFASYYMKRYREFDEVPGEHEDVCMRILETATDDMLSFSRKRGGLACK